MYVCHHLKRNDNWISTLVSRMVAAVPENLTAKPPAEEIDGGTGHSSTSVPASATRDLETATARKRQDWQIRSLGRNGY
ncbi:hypothetical protein N7481_005924 [Penicillium waksmanii]|uniref:uncharacterized protein n=1 Tax=Penicillium waksmanii TaxID=69791 RepID=UPI00254794E8|nr:uncharacterized protein N7481_005924 [Penicillium waksmanii]KAJ5983825.1 hypothetical protein N7481_005924 [Penicillium waksmanii]